MSWGYRKDNGPSTWEKEFPIAKGVRQSPIDIATAAAKYDQTLADSPISITYQPEKELVLKNSGKSIVCQIKSSSVISGGPLQDKEFKLEQFHLHWGSEANKGSEHTIDGKTYAAELHLVHYNTAYGDFGKAVDKPDGLAVLGIMIEVGDKDNADFKKFTDNLSDVTVSGAECKKNVELDPSKLLPGNTKQYWTYLGSLTTPPLYESVNWIVFKEPVKYSNDQLKKLRSLKDSDNACMQDNYRPPVASGTREVRASFK